PLSDSGSKKIEKLEAKFAEIQEELKRERSKAASEKRKRETRQKIIIGGRLLALAKTDQRAAEVVHIAKQNLTDSEKKAFEE
ncbi:hypothetical protein AD933_01010, partial [Acetobacter malorum]